MKITEIAQNSMKKAGVISNTANHYGLKAHSLED